MAETGHIGPIALCGASSPDAQAPRPARTIGLAGLIVLLCLAAGVSPAVTGSAPAPPKFANVDQQVADFYGARGERAIWTDDAGLNPRGTALLASLAPAIRDNGLDVPEIDAAAIRRLAASGAVGRAAAEHRLSRAFVDYVVALHRAPDDFHYVDAELQPQPPAPAALLEGAARATSFERYAAELSRMNPLYEGLRDALRAERSAGASAAALERIRRNLDRARAIPLLPDRRYIVVNSAAAELTFYVGNRPTGTMRVLAGKPEMPTPQLAGLIRFALVNPYWNVPPDLVRDKVAKQVLEQGPVYLDRERLELLSSYAPDARVLAPEQVDWSAVASGAQPLRVRQLPGSSNMMGKVKFMLPNPMGIYLHDTPDKTAFANRKRWLSSGCVRLADAPRLFAWLFGRPQPAPAASEQRVDLAEPVPVFIVYLTATGEGGRFKRSDDIYRRDADIDSI